MPPPQPAGSRRTTPNPKRVPQRPQGRQRGKSDATALKKNDKTDVFEKYKTMLLQGNKKKKE